MVCIKYRLIPNPRCQSSALVAAALNPLFDMLSLVIGAVVTGLMRMVRSR